DRSVLVDERMHRRGDGRLRGEGSMRACGSKYRSPEEHRNRTRAQSHSPVPTVAREVRFFLERRDDRDRVALLAAADRHEDPLAGGQLDLRGTPADERAPGDDGGGMPQLLYQEAARGAPVVDADRVAPRLQAGHALALVGE